MRKLIVKIFSLCAVLTFFAAPGVQAETFLLKINDVSGIESPWPLAAGIPFAEGELDDPSAIRITSGGREVPSQVDVAATWRDGSIRWALAGFTAPCGGDYTVEYGKGVKRGSSARPLQVNRKTGEGFVVDTGVALYSFADDRLLPEDAWLVEAGRRIQILEGSGRGAYLIDNAGRIARVAGEEAGIENTVLKEGPGRFVVKRSGWYVSETGERLARADMWFYFAAGTPYVKITHSLILTGDTNSVWIKDYGLEFKTPVPPSDVYCALGEPGEEEVRHVKTEGSEVYMMQDVYPHFAEREYRALVGKGNEVLEEFMVAGDWSHGDYGGFGITIAMPWLSERFPKEISFGPRGARAVLWSGRSGRELDFRSKTLLEEYWQTWAEKGHRWPNPAKIADTKSNAQGVARTHDMWFLPGAGLYDEDTVRKTGIAGSRPPLVISDPAQICKSEALGWPMQHKDTEKFPDAEKFISDCWQRLLIPIRAFPMNGFISWGCYPDVSYYTLGGRIMSGFERLTGLMEYGLRRVPFLMYARSGERTYYEYGYKFGRYTGDYGQAHWDAPGKEKGAFIAGIRYGVPLPWAGNTTPNGIIDGEIRHWLNEYYLTGDERSLHLVKNVKEYYKRRGYPKSGIISFSRILLTLSVMDWDEESVKASRDFIHSVIDLESQNGIRGGGYGPEYKDFRNAYDFTEYYLETGDETVKAASIKLLDQRYRFDRRGGPINHRNYDPYSYSMAYRVTGDKRFRAVAESALRDVLYYSEKNPLSPKFSRMSRDTLEWKAFPHGVFLSQAAYHSPFIGIPAVLKLIAEEGWSGSITPLAVFPMKFPGAKVIFLHEKGMDTRLSVYLRKEENMDILPEVFPYGGFPGASPLDGVTCRLEQRMPYGDSPHYHAFITVPAGKDGGLYLLSLGKGITFTVLDSTAGKVALFCPEGFWNISEGVHGHGGTKFQRSGLGRPMFFRVPGEIEKLEIFMGYPATVKRADGSVALEMSDSNVGKFSLPVEEKPGVWSIEPYIRDFTGDSPAGFYRLLNVESVVAFGSPSLLPETARVTPAETVSPVLSFPDEPVGFVEGIDGKAVRISGELSMSFPGGEKLKQGGYAFFPGGKGTVEFWFRAAISTLYTPLVSFQNIEKHFIRAAHIDLLHSYYRRGTPGPYSLLQMKFIPSVEGASPAGYQAEHFFRAGEWVHIAYTWDVTKGITGSGGKLAIFLNGRKLPYSSSLYGLRKLEGKQKIELREEGEEVLIGPFDGLMDMLRISDVVRYDRDFTPSKKAPSPDGNTRALFLFDGNLKGVSAFSTAGVEAR